jgi:hypothetical protein
MVYSPRQSPLKLCNLAIGGDISCNFDSPMWFQGHCNWIYSFTSLDEFTFTSESIPALAGKQQ